MRHLLAAALAVMLSLPVAAQDFNKGGEAYLRGDYETALREWGPLAEQGDAAAQADLVPRSGARKLPRRQSAS